MDQFGQAAGALIHRSALPPAGRGFSLSLGASVAFLLQALHEAEWFPLALGFGLCPLIVSRRLLSVYVDANRQPTVVFRASSWA